jgi:glycosyltransferase involved in cell wall biosynthesis
VHSTEAERRPGAPDPVITRIEQRMLRAAAHVVTPGRATRRRVIEDARIPAARVTAIPNMLSTYAPPPQEMGAFEARRVVFLGRLTRQKGLDRFADVARRVTAAVPDCVFEVWGEGEERALIEGRYPVTFRGPIGWDHRGEALAGASVLLAPSRAEPFGMVVLEAMQHRVAAVYPKASGAAEVLRTGVKVEPGNIASVSARVRRLLTSWTAWEDMVEAQADEIQGYVGRDYPRRLMEVWKAVLPPEGDAAPAPETAGADEAF